ncbi:hypothetical protein BD414DRAFT_498724 [Trametes punicea]|nr:hypothetical protein BD414DRAFT_498724 [Trametes punicea]
MAPATVSPATRSRARQGQTEANPPPRTSHLATSSSPTRPKRLNPSEPNRSSPDRVDRAAGRTHPSNLQRATHKGRRPRSVAPLSSIHNAHTDLGVGTPHDSPSPTCLAHTPSQGGERAITATTLFHFHRHGWPPVPAACLRLHRIILHPPLATAAAAGAGPRSLTSASEAQRRSAAPGGCRDDCGDNNASSNAKPLRLRPCNITP